MLLPMAFLNSFSTVVSIGFNASSVSVSEGDGSAPVCLEISGVNDETGRPIVFYISTEDGTALSKRKEIDSCTGSYNRVTSKN
jgi:hypothetical protein